MECVMIVPIILQTKKKVLNVIHVLERITMNAPKKNVFQIHFLVAHANRYHNYKLINVY